MVAEIIVATTLAIVDAALVVVAVTEIAVRDLGALQEPVPPVAAAAMTMARPVMPVGTIRTLQVIAVAMIMFRTRMDAVLSRASS